MATATVAPTRQISIKKWHYCAAFLCACVLVFLRCPQALLHARFYAEDGAIFYATAYNYGWWKVLFSPYQGYIHLVPRLSAALALLVPFAVAPLVMNSIALIIEAIPPILLLSPVSAKLGSVRFRMVLAILYLVVPNAAEVISCITESQWILALCAILIVVGIEPIRKLPYVAILATACLTGPFCIFVAPFAFEAYLREKTSWRKTVLGVSGGSAVVQICCLLASARFHSYLGASVRSFIRILTGQVYLGTLFGANRFATLPIPVLIILCVCFSVFIALCIVHAPELRRIAIFSAVLLAASLLRPVVYANSGAWERLAIASDVRYWFLPCVTLAWIIAAACRNRTLRIPGYILLAVMVFGIARDFHRPGRTDNEFPLYAQRLEQASVGSSVAIPLEQRGWTMVLTRHQ